MVSLIEVLSRVVVVVESHYPVREDERKNGENAKTCTDMVGLEFDRKARISLGHTPLPLLHHILEDGEEVKCSNIPHPSSMVDT